MDSVPYRSGPHIAQRARSHTPVLRALPSSLTHTSTPPPPSCTPSLPASSSSVLYCAPAPPIGGPRQIRR
eukprot:2592163-Rhodomonas_salina.1